MDKIEMEVNRRCFKQMLRNVSDKLATEQRAE